MEDVKELMLEAKPHLLGYDDTTFYERLISGEAVMAEAWDGWCHTASPGTPTSIRGLRGGLRPVGRRDGVLKDSENKEAAFAFINMILDPVIAPGPPEHPLQRPQRRGRRRLPEELSTRLATLDEVARRSCRVRSWSTSARTTLYNGSSRFTWSEREPPGRAAQLWAVTDRGASGPGLLFTAVFVAVPVLLGVSTCSGPGSLRRRRVDSRSKLRAGVRAALRKVLSARSGSPG